MEIVRELQKSEIDELRRLKSRDHDFWYIDQVLSMPHVCAVQISPSDYSAILINSSTQARDLLVSEYPSMRAVVEDIRRDREFLSRKHPGRGLDGPTVMAYMNEFVEKQSRPAPFFVTDRSEFSEMNRQGEYYVLDGMHHLVAYGLATELKDEGFPIKGYYGSRYEHTFTSSPASAES